MTDSNVAPAAEPNGQDAAVSPEEIIEIHSKPAIWVNKTYLTSGGFNVRVTFAEKVPDGVPQSRAAVLMSVSDLLKLRDLINRIEREVETVELPREAAVDG